MIAGHDGGRGEAKASWASCLKQVPDRVLRDGLVLQHSSEDLASVALAKTEIRAFSFRKVSQPLGLLFADMDPDVTIDCRGPVGFVQKRERRRGDGV